MPSYKYDNIGLAQAGVSTDSKVPLNVAVAFLKLLTGPTGGTLFAEYGHNIPAAKLTSAEWTKASPEHIMGEALALQGLDPTILHSTRQLPRRSLDWVGNSL